MMKTDLDQIRAVSKALLMTEPTLTKFSPMIVQHPFTKYR